MSNAATARFADRLGFDLDGWKVGIAGDEAALVLLRDRYPFAMLEPLDPGATYDLVLLLNLQGAGDLAGVAAEWAKRTRWLAATLPDAPGHWEALDALPVVHRFVVDHDVGPERTLLFGFVVQGDLQVSDLRVRPARDLLLPPVLEPPLAATGLRLLVLADRSWARLLCGDYYDPVHVRALHSKIGCQNDCDAHYDPAKEHVVAAARRAFPGFEPDAVLLVCPEYSGIPAGLEDSPWPTIAAISDWNVNFRDLVPCLGVFDLVVGDSNGMQILRALGFPRVHYWPMYSFNPAIHRPGDPGEKTHDLAFLGNLNHRVQRERSRYLHKVARLSDACKVFVGAGLFGADYARILQLSRLVFNRSIRGELNLRCYEAPACGSLLLLEDTNDEVRTLFTPGVHCALYGPGDLPDVVLDVLGENPRRQAITAAGTERAKASSYTAHFSGLLGLIRELVALPRRSRPFAALPEAERLHRYGRLAYHRTVGDRLYQSLNLLVQAIEADPSAPIAADLAAVLGSFGEEQARRGHDDQASASFGQARAYIDQALRERPDQPVWQLICARLAARDDRALATDLLARIMAGDAGPVEGLIYPMTFSHLEVELETLSHSLVGRPADRAAQTRKLLSWQAAVWLGDLMGVDPDGAPTPAAALPYYQVACDLRPDLAETQIKLGNALLDTGEPERAAAAYRMALLDNPLSADAARGLVTALVRAGDPEGATTFYDETLGCLTAVPMLLERLPELQRAYWEAVTLSEASRTEGTLGLDGLRARNYLLFAEGERWLAGLDAYVGGVAADADACLVLYGTELSADGLLARIESHLEAGGRIAEDLPDILVVERRLTPRQEQQLITLVDGVYPPADRTRLAQVEAAGKPLLAEFT